ncbi:biotin-independent malonate decarboxylase subunit gamma [uncultured Marinobacter sp.]|uniref:biotin-independent malonate decarboxylase subunit gamma n=1 Tax=uncultured Marinobacter sp. TaxID=187379 RepID=UPI0025E193BA|nr:biotin-independent malonate decarboxylase subunit gamma [uncultured Marinobacter sp.]
MSENSGSLRGRRWFDALTHSAGREGPAPSLQVAEVNIAGQHCYVLLVKPEPENVFPRARAGEVGLLEGWGIAQAIDSIIEANTQAMAKPAVIAVVDVPSQAYGRREEALGIHQSLAAAVSAYARARLAGHPIVSLLVGKAMSGGFLAHGYQANRILALGDEGVQVHAMGKAAAARITLRTEEELDQLASEIPPMAYDLENYASLGMLDALIEVSSADSPDDQDVERVKGEIAHAVSDIKPGDVSLRRRLAGTNRKASRLVREMMRAQWDA